jgi:fibronectin-binding autotransporter adhesin
LVFGLAAIETSLAAVCDRPFDLRSPSEEPLMNRTPLFALLAGSAPSPRGTGLLRVMIALTAFFICGATYTSAVAQTWNGLGANDNFSNANNWTPVGVPANDGTANLTFSGSTRLTPNVDVPWSTNSISIGATAGAFTIGGNSLTIGAGGITDNQASSLERITPVISLAANQTWSVNSTTGDLFVGIPGSSIVNNGNTLTIAGSGQIVAQSAVSGAGGITVNSGFLDMDEAGHTFTGPINLNGGFYFVRVGSDFGSSSGAMNFNGGIVLCLSPNLPVGRSVSIASGGATIRGSGQGTGVIFNSTITGPGALTVDQASWVTLAAANSYSGGTHINGLGVVLCTTSTIQGNVALSDGSLVFTQSVNGAYSGNITGTANTGEGVLLFGSGVVSLGGTNTYSGMTAIGGNNSFNSAKTGFLRLLNSAALSPNSAIFMAINSGLDLNNFSATSLGIDGNGSVSLGSGTYTVGGDNAVHSFAGSIDGTGGFTKIGAGTQALTGTNTYSGATTINGGVLQAGSGTALSNTTAVNLANGGGIALDLNGFSMAIGSLAGGGASGGNVTLGSGNLTLGNNGLNTSFAGIISGSGGVTKVGSGTLTLTNVNTYGGGTTISAGTLQLGDGVASNGFIAGAIIDSSRLVIANPNPLGFAGPINGVGSIVKNSVGTLTLGGAGSYSGGLTINSGTVISGAAPVPTPAIGIGSVTLAGGTLALQGQQTNPPVSALLGSFYNSTPKNVSNSDPDYNSQQSLFAHLNGLVPATVSPTNANGYAKLDFSNANYSSAAPFGANPATATQANFGFSSNVNYEVKLNGVINITNPGSYTFSTTSDDGSVIFLDNGNLPLVNNNSFQTATTRSGTAVLTAGPHLVTIGFYQGAGGNGLLVQYSGPDTNNSTTTIPNSALSTLNPMQSFNNNVTVTANSIVDVSGSLTATMGALSINGSTFSLTSADQSGNPFSLSFSNASLTGNAVFSIANSTSGGAGKLILGGLNDGGTGRSITKTNSGTLEVTGTPTLSNNASIQVTRGTLRFNVSSGAANIGTGVTLTVAPGATLELAGSVSALSSSAGNRADILNNSSAPAGLLVSGTNQEVGSINGTGNFVINPSSQLVSGPAVQQSLTINGNGQWTLRSGDVLTPGSTVGSLSGSGTVNLNSSTLTVGDSNNASSSYAGSISGSGGVTKAGTGTFSLTNTNSYGGTTTILQGALKLITAGTNNLSQSQSIDIAQGASLDVTGVTGAGGFALNGSIGQKLEGKGTVIGNVTVGSGSHLAPGDSVGTLTLSGLSLAAGSILDFEFNSTPLNDFVNVTAANGLTINGGAFSLLQEGTTSPYNTPGTYHLMHYVGALQGNGTAALSVLNPQARTTYAFSNNTSLSDVDLTITAVPEPSSLIMLAFGVLVLSGVAPRRRRQTA